MKTNPLELPKESSRSLKMPGGQRLTGSIHLWMGVLALSALFMSSCSEKTEDAEVKSTTSPPETATVQASASTSGYKELNADADDSLWTGLRGIQETMPSAGLTFRVQAVEGDAGRETLAKDLAAKLKKAGFESVYESVKPDEKKPAGSALVKCHFTRAQITEKVFAVVGRHYIGGQFELRSDDDMPKQETVITIYAKPVFSDGGRVTFE
jgi:hypothetical protein